MLKKLKIAGAVLLGLFVLVTAVGFLLPRKAHVESSIVISAPPETIYTFLSSPKDGWSQWAPFVYPGTTLTFEGPTDGVGAMQRWDGPESGDGSMKIVRADPARGIELELALMQESYKINSSLLCDPAGPGQTKVTWVDDFDLGNSPYRRWFGLAIPNVLKKQFDQGLGALKEKSEKGPRVAAQ